MPPIHMTRDQRAALLRLNQSPLPANELPREHAEKFVNHGLAVRETMRIRITERGQLELLRQRFRGGTTRLSMRMRTPVFLARFGRAVQKRSLRLSRSWRETGRAWTVPAAGSEERWYDGLRPVSWRLPAEESPPKASPPEEPESSDPEGSPTPASAA
ncbi:MAG: hypothetical protein MI824_12255 [Hyphomicrobiales bacterium]|nr:hypothetical protein [Hyphomicrobiales bacterium]